MVFKVRIELTSFPSEGNILSIKQYEGLKYYDNIVTRTDNSIISDTTINYAKIDIDKLLEIEGEEDNVIENGKVKLSTWLNFAKKFGVTCED